jgi:hypothetical protein
MSIGPVEVTQVAVIVRANVQDNGDGTWTAAAQLKSNFETAIGSTREEALSKVSELLSVETVGDS